jgi:hypothetical protein
VRECTRGETKRDVRRSAQAATLVIDEYAFLDVKDGGSFERNVRCKSENEVLSMKPLQQDRSVLPGGPDNRDNFVRLVYQAYAAAQ